MLDIRYTVFLFDEAGANIIVQGGLTWDEADYMMVHHIERGGTVDWERE